MSENCNKYFLRPRAGSSLGTCIFSSACHSLLYFGFVLLQNHLPLKRASWAGHVQNCQVPLRLLHPKSALLQDGAHSVTGRAEARIQLLWSLLVLADSCLIAPARALGTHDAGQYLPSAGAGCWAPSSTGREKAPRLWHFAFYLLPDGPMPDSLLPARFLQSGHDPLCRRTVCIASRVARPSWCSVGSNSSCRRLLLWETCLPLLSCHLEISPAQSA